MRKSLALLLLLPALAGAEDNKSTVADEFAANQIPDLPASAPGELPGLKQKASTAPHVQPTNLKVSTSLVSPTLQSREGAAPVLDLSDIPTPLPKEDAVEVVESMATVHGVILRRNGAIMDVINEVGSIIRFELPEHVYLIDIAGGGFVEPEGVEKGDFIAAAGQEQSSRRTLVAYLKLGTQPTGNYADLGESVEACYQAAVTHLAKDKKEE